MTGISRSGRVRKKSSKLVDFRSPDDIDAEKATKRSYTHKSPSTKSAQRSNSKLCQTPKSTIKSYFQPVLRFQNNDNNVTLPAIKPEPSPATIELEDFIDAEKEIDMLLSPSKYSNKDENTNVANSNEVESDEDYNLTIDTTVRKSAYMSEKSTKKKMYKDGEIILAKPQRKDKGKPRYTAYMLWAKEIRQEIMKSNPNMDFSQASRRLSTLWANVPSNEKHIWRRRAKRVTIKNKRALKLGEKLTTKYLNKQQRKKPGRKPKNPNPEMITTTPKKAKTEQRKSNGSQEAITRKHRTISNNSSITSSHGRNSNPMNSNDRLGAITPGAYKVIGIGPTDVAAHLKLLGDNLTIIGQRLKEHEVCLA